MVKKTEYINLPEESRWNLIIGYSSLGWFLTLLNTFGMIEQGYPWSNTLGEAGQGFLLSPLFAVVFMGLNWAVCTIGYKLRELGRVIRNAK